MSYFSIKFVFYWIRFFFNLFGFLEDSAFFFSNLLLIVFHFHFLFYQRTGYMVPSTMDSNTKGEVILNSIWCYWTIASRNIRVCTGSIYQKLMRSVFLFSLMWNNVWMIANWIYLTRKCSTVKYFFFRFFIFFFCEIWRRQKMRTHFPIINGQFILFWPFF